MNDAQQTIIKLPGPPALALARHGEGAETILFLHGIGGNWRNWTAQLVGFSPFFTAVAWDMRGYGDSANYEGPGRFSDWVADVLRVIDFLSIARVHLVGLSLGGRIAQRFCLDHPERVASLVLADTRSESGNVRTPEQKREFYDLRAKPILAGRTMADIAPTIARSLMGPHATPEVFDALVDSMKRIRPDAYLKAIAANLDEDYAGNASRIAAPTLVVVGEHDTLTPPDLSRKLANEIPQAFFAQIPRAGHLSNIEQPELFNQALLAFYQRIIPRMRSPA